MLNTPEHVIETLIRQGAPLDRVEAHIDGLPLDQEQRSALWLLAWLKATSPAAQNTMGADRLAHLR